MGMVHNHESPGGMVFHTFGMISGVCIFLSMYPFHMRNVYTGAETFLFTNVYWTTFRQLCPAMGIWLLIGINTYPTAEAIESKGYTKLFCCTLHLSGAGMLFVGYMICELKVLGICPFKMPVGKGRPKIENRELNVRRFLAYLIIIGFFGFCCSQVALLLAKKQGICCPDEWKHAGNMVSPDSDKNEKDRLQTPEIWNTAYGGFLILKLVSFSFEELAGISMVFSHMAVWYYSEERHVDYGNEELQEVYEQEP